MTDLTAAAVYAELDARSRSHALSEADSRVLEKAIAALDHGERFTKRDAARAGVKRDMRVYPRSIVSLKTRDAAEWEAERLCSLVKARKG